MSTIPVYAGEELVGHFDYTAAVSVARIGSTAGEVPLTGRGCWVELLRVDGGFVLLEHQFDDDFGFSYGEAQLIDRAGALLWLRENCALPLPDAFPELNLRDFTPEKPTKGKKPSVERANAIVEAIRGAGVPLRTKDIKKALGLKKSKGSLPHHLAWMAHEGTRVIKLTGGRGYWLAGVPLHIDT